MAWVLRFLSVRVAGDIDPATREEKAYVAPQYDLQEEVAAEESEPAEGFRGEEHFVAAEGHGEHGDEVEHDHRGAPVEHAEAPEAEQE